MTGKFAYQVVAISALTMIVGCFTTGETPYPETAMSSVSGAVTPAVAVRGFEATVAETVWVTGYSTAFVGGHPGWYYWHPGHFETIRTDTAVSQLKPTDVFFEKAKERFEASGFTTMASQPDYIVEAKFSGPFLDSNAASLSALRMICTLFLSDSISDVWHAKLKIYDNHTGKLIFTREYEQRYENVTWSLIPIFGIASCERNERSFTHYWCHAALTDRVTADASAYLVNLKPNTPNITAKENKQ